MINTAITLTAIFSQPMSMENNGLIFFWSVPLVIIISTVYKATKLDKVTDFRFVKESAGLTATILGFMLLIAVVLWVLVAVLT